MATTRKTKSPKTTAPTKPAARRGAKNSGAARTAGAAAKSPDARSSAVFREGSKGAAIVKQLSTGAGASIAELAEASGWQAHSVRGFLSGTLKKKHGLQVIAEKDDDGVRRYRIAA